MRKSCKLTITAILFTIIISLCSCSEDRLRNFFGVQERLTESERIIAATGLYSVKHLIKLYRDGSNQYDGITPTDYTLSYEEWRLSEAEFTDNFSFIQDELEEQTVRVSGDVAGKYTIVQKVVNNGIQGQTIENYRTCPAYIEIDIKYEFYGRPHTLQCKYRAPEYGLYSFSEFKMDGNEYNLEDVNSMLTKSTYLYTGEF